MSRQARATNSSDRATRAFEGFLELLRCPSCGGSFAAPGADALRCTGCMRTFPIAGDRPVLIDEARSIFSHVDYAHVEPHKETLPNESGLGAWWRRLPSPPGRGDGTAGRRDPGGRGA